MTTNDLTSFSTFAFFNFLKGKVARGNSNFDRVTYEYFLREIRDRNQNQQQTALTLLKHLGLLMESGDRYICDPKTLCIQTYHVIC